MLCYCSGSIPPRAQYALVVRVTLSMCRSSYYFYWFFSLSLSGWIFFLLCDFGFVICRIFFLVFVCVQMGRLLDYDIVTRLFLFYLSLSLSRSACLGYSLSIENIIPSDILAVRVSRLLGFHSMKLNIVRNKTIHVQRNKKREARKKNSSWEGDRVWVLTRAVCIRARAQFRSHRDFSTCQVNSTFWMNFFFSFTHSGVVVRRATIKWKKIATVCPVWEYETFVWFFSLCNDHVAGQRFIWDYFVFVPVRVVVAVVAVLVLFWFFAWNMSHRKIPEHRPKECSQAAEFQIYLAFCAPIARLSVSLLARLCRCCYSCGCCFSFRFKSAIVRLLLHCEKFPSQSRYMWLSALDSLLAYFVCYCWLLFFFLHSVNWSINAVCSLFQCTIAYNVAVAATFYSLLLWVFRSLILCVRVFLLLFFVLARCLFLFLHQYFKFDEKSSNNLFELRWRRFSDYVCFFTFVLFYSSLF